ncbi:dihydrolipoyl dehydrogenase family protein [Allosediminivita pacifica]|uniref:Pyruvate/2-oxoglutarate dehydrogenase complex dihydrolipoamide dehydrogenase (E3) component n=1 Tax=Allosediminivita pacifica TaxID=1267769 RepID=A0A2T6AX54_9RHOB|nr:FAD-dependent oxidoreductase [Allosediminivita pacifica]PTX48376.1 pyruvate/2-oxoglutarate dehydrogenase complex dihydrolipoamide dehydrogenase (E3) component [Allosediminivita pacifica]GGB10956.1 dihydrolipoamide dehydrogenase [Allosediminivita pacifica]
MEKIRCDLLVIGAGSGGLSVAAGASQMGANVVLLEGGEMGGDCLNYGCVPSKALIASAKVAHGMTTAAPYGISPRSPEIDYAAAKDHVKQAIATIAPVDSQERFEGLGVRVIREFGRFVDHRTVEAGQHSITARRVVIATGSSPFVPPIPGLEDVPYLTNESLWELRERPSHLLIIGGGPIGMEMAQAHRRLGCRVTVIEGGKAFAKDDPETAAVVLEALREEGVEIAEDALASAVRKDGPNLTVETEDGRSFTGTHLLIAVGRKANVEGLDLERAGIKRTKTGVDVDDNLRTANRRVYAVGDAAGGMMFTHVAGYHGGQVIRPLLFALPGKARTAHLPTATYTDPELAQVGLTEAQAREKHGDKAEVARFEYAHNDRAIAERKTAGLIKVMVVGGKPVGASIAGHQAGEHIALWSLAIANGLKMSQVSAMVAPYPTYAEINKRAAGAYFTPRLFGNDTVKKVVRLVQRWLP